MPPHMCLYTYFAREKVGREGEGKMRLERKRNAPHPNDGVLYNHWAFSVRLSVSLLLQVTLR